MSYVFILGIFFLIEKIIFYNCTVSLFRFVKPKVSNISCYCRFVYYIYLLKKHCSFSKMNLILNVTALKPVCWVLTAQESYRY